MATYVGTDGEKTMRKKESESQKKKEKKEVIPVHK